MSNVNRNQPVADTVPWSDRLTSYDEAHLVVYLRLLDAVADGASDEEMARVVLGIDPKLEPARARTALEQHLRRAKWMTDTGCRRLLEH